MSSFWCSSRTRARGTRPGVVSRHHASLAESQLSAKGEYHRGDLDSFQVLNRAVRGGISIAQWLAAFYAQLLIIFYTVINLRYVSSKDCQSEVGHTAQYPRCCERSTDIKRGSGGSNAPRPSPRRTVWVTMRPAALRVCACASGSH